MAPRSTRRRAALTERGWSRAFLGPCVAIAHDFDLTRLVGQGVVLSITRRGGSGSRPAGWPSQAKVTITAARWVVAPVAGLESKTWMKPGEPGVVGLNVTVPLKAPGCPRAPDTDAVPFPMTVFEASRTSIDS